ncbi:carboxypeptidase-like regulatory domain-containing protein [Bremerella sp. T1]|uniref:carboxypeptidase-like regulatory domain-containing protein n=1 Tax=Bremerella sp. TYQ1 TaxID=3119568 RepID=UPI001CC9E0DE|nr:carboxypeptidase-like regulatory domain-containing protein [Bremerella volcania]UBM34067.1 carboxypeptidase-like regulatory domain-containing protein [Bremerella volcania]
MLPAMSSLRVLSQSGVLLLLISAIGCSSGEYSDLGQVTGQVTMDGQPLPEALVRFSPSSGRPAMGVTDAEGNYELIYVRDIRGAEPGEYDVEITTWFRPETIEDAHKKRTEKIPTKYNKRTTLSATVEQGKNEIDFPLESK